MLIRRIAKEIPRCKITVKNVVKRGIYSSVQKRPGANSKLSQKDQRRIIRLATLKKTSAAEISSNFERKESRSTVTSVLKQV